MHEQFLLAALGQAKLSLGECAPNPCVGAVAVHNGEIIAQASHKGAGTPHAEQLLLAQLPPKILGLIVYVTLEPCNHWGRTPPCVDALIDYGVAHLVYAYKDPNPLVEKNDSPRLLMQQGIKVTHSPVKEIDAFYQSYYYWTRTKKTWVTAKIAQSLDGKVGVSNSSDRLMLSNDLCAQFTHQMRAAHDVILTTARTIRADNPKMNVRLNGVERSKPLAILDTHLTLNESPLIFSTAKHCHIFHDNTISAPKTGSSHCSYHATPSAPGGLDLHAVIEQLGALGFHQAWVEAGGTLFSALHQQCLVNSTHIYIVPTLIGKEGVEAYQNNAFFARSHQLSWQMMGDNIMLSLDWQDTSCLPD